MGLMSDFSTLKKIEQRVRSSKSYHDWILRNKSFCCFACGATENIQCHHVVELYHFIRGHWNIYADEEKTFQSVIDMHNDDKCECVTLCETCHAIKHPARRAMPQQDAHIDLWTVIPRSIKLTLNHSVVSRPDSIGLVSFQTLLGIGWYVINKQPHSRMIEFHRRRFAELLGKKAGTSFNNCLNRAINELNTLGVIAGSHIADNQVEIHLTQSYLDELLKNPWFVPLSDITTNQMCVLALRWFLGMQSRRKQYRIGLDKLTGHLGITIKSHYRAIESITKACEKISWVKIRMEKDMCIFTIEQRGATPVFSLRHALEDSLTK